MKTPRTFYLDSGRFVTILAEWTGLEPATPGVTGRYSNQLNYHSSYYNFIAWGRYFLAVHEVEAL